MYWGVSMKLNKKIIILILSILCLGLTSCDNSFNKSSMDINIAGNMPKLVWPSTNLTDLLPRPNSSVGKIEELSYDIFCVYVGQISEFAYNDYVIKCMDRGFNLDVTYISNTFYGKNYEGYTLHIQYISISNTMYIKIKAPKEDSVSKLNANALLEATKKYYTLYVNDRLILKKCYTISNAHSPVFVYTSSNNDVVRIDDGVVVALKSGSSTITVSLEDNSSIYCTFVIIVIG